MAVSKSLLFGCLSILVAALAVQSGDLLQVWPCTPGSERQTWAITTGGTPNDNIRLGGANGVPFTGLVFNTLGYSNSTGGTLTVWTFAPGTPWGQQWQYDATHGYIRSKTNGLCAGTANSTGSLPAGTLVTQVPCAAVDAAQFWYNSSTGLMVWGKDPTLCLDAATTVSCAQQPYASYPYCNSSLLVQDRVTDLLQRLEPVEAAAMLSASNNGVPRLGIPKLTFGEALHGVATGCGQAAPGSTGCPTSFPTGLALGSTLNRTLWSMVGDTIGKESRALFNQGAAQSMFFTPDINTFRDPRWGRGMEVASESSYINGEFAAAYIWSFQGLAGPDGGVYMRSVSMPKHFSGYDQEGNGGVHDRTNFCAPIPMQYLVGYHWPAFKAALQRGKAGGLMCSANGVNGYPSCAHSDYNNGVLREEWGWEGAMVTDGNGIGYLYDTYGVGKNALDCQPIASSPADACGWGLRGGVDVELGETLNNYVLDAVQAGNVTFAQINTALARTMQYLFKLGLMDPPSLVPWTALGPADVDTAAARQLAYEAAVQAVILLRNNASTVSPNGPGTPVLPLSLPSLAGKTLSIIGPNANNASTLLANYHGENRLAQLHTPLLAITALAQAAGVTVKSAPGCDTVVCANSSYIAPAVAAAQGSEVIVLVGGINPWIGGPNPVDVVEGEELDRTNITLPGFQEELISALLDTGIPVVLVIMRGGGVALSDGLYSDPRLTTIVDNIYPGEMGGDALAAVLFGNEAPSGRLTTTLYPSSFTSTRSIIDYNMTSADGITYEYYTGQPEWPFGYGLSYTTWQLNWLDNAAAHITVDAHTWKASGRGNVTAEPAWGVNVTNTGTVTSSISVLAMISSGVPGQPLQELFDFQRASAVRPGQTVTLVFTLPQDVTALVDEQGEVALVSGTHTVSIIIPGAEGSSTELHGSVRVLVDTTEEGTESTSDKHAPEGRAKIVLQKAVKPM